jgi:aspartate aminotransferase
MSIPGERIGAICVNPLLENSQLLLHCMAHANEIIGIVHATRLGMRAAVLSMPATSDTHLYDENRSIICQMFDELGIQYVKPDGAFYVFPKIPDGIPENDFCTALAKNGIIVVPGSGFGGPGFYRMSFCKRPEEIRRAVPAFKAAYAEALKLKAK